MILWQTDFHLKQIQVCSGFFKIFSMEQFVKLLLANLIFRGKNEHFDAHNLSIAENEEIYAAPGFDGNIQCPSLFRMDQFVK